MRQKKYSDEHKQELWARFLGGDESAFNLLWEAYIPLVNLLAFQIKSKLPDHVEVGDIINDGMIGLADAIRRFDHSSGRKFETYATIRIRGEMYDRLRDYDPVSRYYREKFKKLNTAIDALTETLGREPKDHEIAAEIPGWDIEEVRDIRAYYLNSFPSSLNEYVQDDSHEVFSLAELIPDRTLGDNSFIFQEKDIEEKMLTALQTLKELESLVVYLKIYEGKTFEEIAEVIGVKMARASQIYAEAMSKLEKAMS